MNFGFHAIIRFDGFILLQSKSISMINESRSFIVTTQSQTESLFTEWFTTFFFPDWEHWYFNRRPNSRSHQRLTLHQSNVFFLLVFRETLINSCTIVTPFQFSCAFFSSGGKNIIRFSHDCLLHWHNFDFKCNSRGWIQDLRSLICYFNLLGL